MSRGLHFFIIVIQCYTIEFEERILHLVCWCRHTRVERYSFQNFRVVAEVNTATLFNTPEIDSVDCSALMWDHWWLHVSEQSPGDWFEENMTLDV